MKKNFCSVIIVTHNSERVLPKAVQALRQQTRPPDQIIIVDSGSKDTGYLKPYTDALVKLETGDIGFCKGNNIGYQHVAPECDYLFLVNPDLFLSQDYLEKAIAYLEKPENQQCGAVTGTTLGYDIESDQPTGRYDSTGVFSTWYGRWYDRGQGQSHNPQLYQKTEETPAICGAVFFCRRKALDAVLVNGSEILDSSFYMNTEDIDLSLRLRDQGWKLDFVPGLTAWHCRGWSPDRSKMPRWCRLCSARNEWRIHYKYGSPHKLFYSTLKWAAVQWLDW